MTTNQANQKARELLPCPFCGREAEIKRRGTARQSMLIGCTNCHAELESGDVCGLTKPENYDWNTRHYPADEQDWKQMAVGLATNYHNHGMLPKQHPQRETCPRCKTLATFDAMMKGTK
jgi:ssDNA-binding Zn-finger/Zn-ribbon topoisomerase 1